MKWLVIQQGQTSSRDFGGEPQKMQVRGIGQFPRESGPAGNGYSYTIQFNGSTANIAAPKVCIGYHEIVLSRSRLIWRFLLAALGVPCRQY
jgi:hypothetical protein